MKAGNILPAGTFELEFKGHRLHGVAADLSDDDQHRIAVHEYDRRDGAATEWMGKGSWQSRITLVWIDADGFADRKTFFDDINTNPSGLLIHPIHGKRQATCSGTSGARLAAQESNTYTTPVTFMDNSINPDDVATSSQGVPAKSAAVVSQAAVMMTAADFE